MSLQYTEVIFDIQTQTITTRPYTEAEIEIAKQEKAILDEKTKQLKLDELAKNALKDKLLALGLNADDLRVLGL